MFHRIFFNLVENLFLSVLLCLTAVVGDSMLVSTISKGFKAVTDNLTHAVIGGLSWFIVCFNCKRYSTGTIFEIFMCTILSSIIDIDHFIAARSLRLRDATSLSQRPILHCSTFPVVLILLLAVLALIAHSESSLVCSLILFTAFGSHHTRDATRRGYWFCPYGSTPPVPYKYYVFLTLAIPYCVSVVLNYFVGERDIKRTDYTAA